MSSVTRPQVSPGVPLFARVVLDASRPVPRRNAPGPGFLCVDNATEAVLFSAEGKILAGPNDLISCSRRSPDTGLVAGYWTRKTCGTAWPSLKSKGAQGGPASAPLSPSQVSPHAEGAIAD